MARKKFEPPPGFVVYKGRDAGAPELHLRSRWYFEPEEWTGDVYSEAFRSKQAACKAAWDWYNENNFERK